MDEQENVVGVSYKVVTVAMESGGFPFYTNWS